MMDSELRKRVEFAINEQEGNFGILDALEDLYKYAESLERMCVQLRTEKMRTVEVSTAKRVCSETCAYAEFGGDENQLRWCSYASDEGWKDVKEGEKCIWNL